MLYGQFNQPLRIHRATAQSAPIHSIGTAARRFGGSPSSVERVPVARTDGTDDESSLEPLKRQSANIFRQYSGRCAPSRCDSGDTGLGRIESVLFRSWTVDSKCAPRSFQCWRTCLRKSDFARFRSVLGGLSDRSFPIPCLLSERHRS